MRKLIEKMRDWFNWRSKAMQYKAAAEEAQSLLRDALEHAKGGEVVGDVRYTVIPAFSYDNRDCMVAIHEVARNPWVYSLLFKMQQDELCALQKAAQNQLDMVRGRLAMIDTFGAELRRMDALYIAAVNAAEKHDEAEV